MNIAVRVEVHPMPDLLLYAIVVLIWGTTWLPIKYQLGVVPVEVSLIYRFALSSLILFGWAFYRKLPLRFSFNQHLWLILLGGFLFGINYFFIYTGSQYLTSGLVAVLFSMLVVVNIINSAIFFKHHTDRRLLLGVGIGLAGIGLTFSNEILNFSFTNTSSIGLILCLLATFCASLGNMVATRNQKAGLPIIQANAYGMGYGALWMALLCLWQGIAFTYEPTMRYTLSLLYLSLFGSVIAFNCYLILMGRIGASRASYAAVLFPIIALTLSTWLENYHWTPSAITGMLLILGGNVLVLWQSQHTLPDTLAESKN